MEPIERQVDSLIRLLKLLNIEGKTFTKIPTAELMTRSLGFMFLKTIDIFKCKPNNTLSYEYFM